METSQLPERVNAISPKITHLIDLLGEVLLGNRELLENLVTGVLAGGHVLLEGMPGLGKTELVKGLAHLCSIQFSRVQFTPDLLPSDITGSFILEQHESGHREFNFQEGPVFTNILLGDEINRASPKTQSALLEAMAERNVTVMGETRALPKPFFVIATQNPIEMEGTYPLPEAQVDRFLFKLHLGRPSENVLKEIICNRPTGAPPTHEPCITETELLEAILLARDVFISEPVAAYISRLVEASHPDSALAPELVKKYVRHGGSPRAAIALAGAARAQAVVLGRVQAGFDSARQLYPAVMNHRIILDYAARIDGVSVNDVMQAILTSVDEYSKALPDGVK
ncbi:TPA: AAA family ATPase [Candidatus Sumerlaeota bacterium]|nr:AAA family ATPase [Candidatus Sumerlaeota bacterium]